MLAARMHGYKQPLVLEDIKVPEVATDQVLVRVGGAGMCRSDVQLVDGYFAEALKSTFPLTPGHEIAGLITTIGGQVPESAQLTIGDQVVVAAGWGDGICRQCSVGNEQLCEHGSWSRFGPPGGYAEFIPVPYRQLIRMEHRVKWEELAPLTDAGVTPYRAIKKLRGAGVLGPDRVIGVFGASGFGSYAVQYAKLLSAGATVVAFARNDEKLSIAKERGADVVINTRDKSLSDIQDELFRLAGVRKLDAATGCVGSEATIQTGIGSLVRSSPLVWSEQRSTSLSFRSLPVSLLTTVPSGQTTAICRKSLHSLKRARSSTPSSGFSSRTSTRTSSSCARATSSVALWLSSTSRGIDPTLALRRAEAVSRQHMSIFTTTIAV